MKTKFQRLFFDKRKRSILSFTLSLVLIISILNHFTSFAGGGSGGVVTPKEITTLVNHRLSNFYVKTKLKNSKNHNVNVYLPIVKDGQKVVYPQTVNVPIDGTTESQEIATAPDVYKGSGVRIEYIWNISKENMKNVNSGDFFYIDLPPENVISTPTFEAQIKAPNPDVPGETMQIGTFAVVNEGGGKKIRAVLSHNFSNQLTLENGNFKVHGSVHTKIDQVELPFVTPGGETIQITIPAGTAPPPPPVTPGGSGTPGNEETFKPKDSMDKLYKWGTYVAEANQIAYTLSLNLDQVVKIFKQNITNKDLIDAGQPPNVGDEYKVIPKEEYILIDELTSNQVIDVSTIRMGSHFYPPAYEKQSGSYVLTDKFSGVNVFTTYMPSPNSTQTQIVIRPKVGTSPEGPVFIKIDQSGDALAWETFRDAIKAKTTPTIGVWQKKKLILNLGHLPSKTFTYNDYFPSNEAASLDAFIDKYTYPNKTTGSPISAEQATMMKKAYNNQPIINLFIAFRTKPSSETDLQYQNEARTYYKNMGSEVVNKIFNVNTVDLSGYAEQKPFIGEITVIKKWIGTKGAQAKVLVTGSDGNEYRKTLDDTNGWTHKFTGLPITNSGGAITYTVTEEDVPAGYGHTVVKHPTDHIYTITNTEKTSITARKQWQDEAGNSLATSDKPVTLQLYKQVGASDEPVIGRSHTFSSGSGPWTYTFTDLDKADESGPITYLVKETNPPDGYDMIQGGNEANAYTVINKRKIKNIDIPVKKIWQNEAGTEYTDPSLKVNVSLHSRVEPTASFAPVSGTDFELNSGNNWAHTYTVPEKAVVGGVIKDIEYKVVETTVAGFSLTQEGTAGNSYTIKNKKDIENITIPAKKLWKDELDNNLTDASLKVNVSLYSRVDAEAFALVAGTNQELNSTNSWAHTYTVPKVKVVGTEVKTIEYKVVEDPVADFTLTQEGTAANSYTLINKKNIGMISVPVKKIWQNEAGTEYTDPSLKVNVSLHSRVEPTASFTPVSGTNFELNFGNNWAHTYTVPEKAVVGGVIKDIEYKVVETPVAGFTLTQEGTFANAYTLINKKDIENITIPAKKLWKDELDNNLTDASLKVNVSLYSRVDAEAFALVAGTNQELNSTNSWAHTYTVPKVKVVGTEVKPIEYKVVEEPVTDFSLTQEGTAANSYTLINKKNIEMISVPVKKIWHNEAGVVFTDDTLSANVHLESRTDSDPFVKVGGTDITLAKANTWAHTYNVPRQRIVGGILKDIEYKVVETPVTGFTLTQEGTAANAYTLINKKDIENITISAKKLWKDEAGEPLSDDTVTVDISLHESLDGTTFTEVSGTKVTLDKAKTWAHTYTVPKVKVVGTEVKPIEYKVVETPVAGFTLTQEGTAANAYTLINKKDIEMIKIPAKKEWRTESDSVFTDSSLAVKVKLMSKVEGEEFKLEASSEQTLDSSNSWSFEYSVPKVRAVGTEVKLVEYKVVEEAVPGFSQMQEGTKDNGYLVKNKRNPIPIIIIPDPPKPPVPPPVPPSPPTPPEPPTPPVPPTPPLPPGPPIPPSPPAPSVTPPVPPPVETPTLPAPPTPPIIPNVGDDGTIDIDVDGDNIPLGDTDIELDEDGNPKGHTKVKKVKKILAKTGGRSVKLFEIGIPFLSLLLALFVTLKMKRTK